MTRWNWKRWACAIVTGTALTGSFTSFAAEDLPKAGETITLRFPGQKDRVVNVVKSVRKADGSLETEVKDPKTGDSFTLVDPAPEHKIPSVKPSAPAALPPLPKPAPVVAAPVVPAAPAPLPPTVAPAKPAPLPPMSSFTETPQTVVGAGDRRIIGGGKLFNREPEGPSTVPAPAAEEKKPGVLGRVFGKKPTPAPIVSAPAMPAPAVVVPPAPPRVIAGPSTVPTPLPSPVRTNQEPPRVQPVKPVTPPAAPGRVEKVVPPTPVIPPVSAPAAPDTVPVPLPRREPTGNLPQPLPPAPPAKPTVPPIVAPSKPVPPVAVPTIPSVPMSKAPVAPAVAVKPAAKPETVKPASHAPVTTGLPAVVEFHANQLKDALAPSVRLQAAKDLATGPHANSQAVHAVLFHTAKTDLCPAVKADCIEHLAKLGYRDPAFVAFLKTACSDESGEVRIAASDALLKMAK